MKTKHFGILLFIILIFLLLGLNNEPSLAGDNAGYIMWANSLLTNGTLNYTNEPNPQDSRFNLYVLPILLAPVVYFFNGLKYIFLYKLIIILFSLLSIIILYFFIQKIIQNKFKQIILILFFAFNSLFYFYSSQIMAEIIFMFFSLLAIYLLSIFETNHKMKFLFISIVFAFISYYTRTTGIILLISYPLYFLIKKNIKLFLISGITIILIFSIFTMPKYIKKIGKGEKYISIMFMKSQYNPDSGKRTLTDFIKTSIRNSLVYTLKIPADTYFYPLFLKIKPRTFTFVFKALISLFFVLFFILGVYKDKKLKKTVYFFDIYLLLSFAMLLIWQIASSRYLLPLLPFLFFYFYDGIFSLNKTILKNIILIILILNIFSITYLIFLKRINYLPPEWENYYKTIYYLKNKFKDKKLNVMCRKPLLFYLKSNYKYKTVPYPLTKKNKIYLNQINKNNINIIIEDAFKISGVNTSKKYLNYFIKKNQKKLKLLYTLNNPTVKIWQIK